MLAIIGTIVVTVCVLGGFAAHGGNLMVLMQPYEFIIIGGAAGGALLISSPPPLLKAIAQQTIAVFKGHQISKQQYVDLLLLLFELCKTAKANPLSLEPHVEAPENSDIFKKYTSVLKNHHAIHFLCDTLKVQISAPMSPYDLDDLMTSDMTAAHSEEHKVPATVTRIGDAMPGLGIVAAVLGVVNTMGKLTQGKEVIGNSVAAALVGTFIGILISYGYMQPLAAKIEANIGDEGRFQEVIKAAMIAYAKNCSPKICVEFARRTIPPHIRPSFAEIDKATSGIGKSGG